MNRDMYYGSYQGGAYQNPSFLPLEPSGYNINANYQAFGPNVIPFANQNNVPNTNNTYNNSYIDEYDTRISKLERQISRVDQRLRRLETTTGSVTNIEETNNFSNIELI